jgi:hypothetical protein
LWVWSARIVDTVSENESVPNSLADQILLSAVHLLLENRSEHPKSRSDSPSHLYHYTTVEGVSGILKDGCLYASAAYYLNDSSEIDYGCVLFASVLKKWFDDNEKALADRLIPDFIPEMLWQTKAAFSNPESLQTLLSQIYVTCFCEDENLLSQWRAYGQSGGYSIGFRRYSLEHDLNVGTGWYQVRLSQVIYTESEQNKLLTDFVRDLILTLSAPTIASVLSGLTLQERNKFKAGFSEFVGTLVLTEIARFKHPAFSEEKEWRFVVRPYIGPHLLAPNSDMKFRPSRGLLIPYFELRPTDNSHLLPIDSIRYGPTLERRRTENALGFFLIQQGYKNVRLDGSYIPVRL